MILSAECMGGPLDGQIVGVVGPTMRYETCRHDWAVIRPAEEAPPRLLPTILHVYWLCARGHYHHQQALGPDPTGERKWEPGPAAFG